MERNRINGFLPFLFLLGLLPGTLRAAEPSAWAGAYLGVHGGAGRVDNTYIQQAGSSSAVFDMNGSMAGAQFGYNWAAGQAVVGLEAKASSAAVDGSADCVGSLTGLCTVKLNRLYTIQGNLGMSVGSLLAYLFVGAASGEIEVSDELPTATYATSERQTGRLAGVGGVVAFNDRLNGMVEMQATDFGTNGYRLNGANVSVETQLITLILGINYRF